MRAVCLRIGNVVHQADLARDRGLPRTTVQRYLNLLEVSYQLVRIEAYAVNRTKRLMKSPKYYWSDSGLALHLSGDSPPQGAHLENLVLNDILAWRETEATRPNVLYWRTSTGAEVDFVVEHKGRPLAIEVKATANPGYADARHLRTFLTEYHDTAVGGLLLHDGADVFWISENVLAAPWWKVI
jgi:predicted AAA+ superfamily ATPase